MLFFPAIDLKEGKCVRLEQGDVNRSKVFDENPFLRAKLFKDLGCKWIHVVDLDGAFQGKAVNQEAIKEILKIKDLNVQLGGGIRNIESIDIWISLGVKRVILGTAVIKDPQLIVKACKKHPNKIAIGLDVRKGKVAVEGWVEQSEIKALDLAKKFENIGLTSIVYTDISKDGLLMGPSLKETVNFAKNINVPVIASGGVRNIKDLIY